MDITAIQETRWPGEGTFIMGKMMLLYGGNTSSKHEFGTGFLVKNNLWNSIIDFETINERISKLRIKSKWANLSLINVHAPTEDKEDEIKNEFFDTLETTADTIPKNDILIILGDFNQQIAHKEGCCQNWERGKI